MAFSLGDLLVDRIIMGTAEKSDGTLLYTLTNLQEATIDISAESTDVVDGTGAVIKTFYRAKTGEFTATNSTINLPIIGAMSGVDPQYAAANAAINMPRIITTTVTSGVELAGISGDGAENQIVVNGIAKNGTLGHQYELGTGTLTAGQYSVAGGKMTIKPFAEDGVTETKFIIKYNRSVTKNGLKLANRSDKFPTSVVLTLKVLIVDPCEPDTVRAAYVVLPNFQPSPEVSIGIKTDGTIDYKGKLQTSYCGDEKVLYEIYVCQDDVDED